MKKAFHRNYIKSNPLISIIIPTHNRIDLLIDRALASVRAQTYQNLEIIVAAHGCTDDTALTVRRIFDPRIKVIEIPRKVRYPDTPENHWFAGPVDPLNAALKVCKGDYIVRCDDDDILDRHHIKILLDFLTENKYEFVSAAHYTHEGKVKPYNLEGVLVGGVQTWMYSSYLKFLKYNPQCWRKSWNRVNDVDLQDRMWKAGVCMGYLDVVVAHVIPRPGNKFVGLRAYLNNEECGIKR